MQKTKKSAKIHTKGGKYIMKNMGMVKRLGKERFNRKFKDAVILSNRLISE